MKSLFTFLFLILLNSVILYAQWIPSNGPSTGYIQEFTYKGSDIYASSFYPSGIYISRDDGVNWEKTDFNFYYLLISDSNMYSVSEWKLYHSTDDGLSWNIIKNDIYPFNDIAVKDSNIYIASGSLMHSTNYGKTWSYSSEQISSLLITESKIFAGSSGKILSSTDNGLNWQHHPLTNRSVWSLAANGNSIFAGTDTGLYVSNDDGLTWIQSPLKDVWITSLAVKESNIFAGSIGALHISSDNGLNWETIIFSDPARHPEFPTQILTISLGNSTILVGTNYGIYRSTDNGVTWALTGVKDGVSLLFKKDSTFYATSSQGLYSSDDFGETWSHLHEYGFSCITGNSVRLFAGAGSNMGIYYSDNNGKTWNSATLNNRSIMSLASKDSLILAGTDNYGVYRSTNNGVNWTQTSLNILDVWSLTFYDSIYFAGTANSGVYRSTDKGKTWFQTSLSNVSPSAMAVNSKKILAGVYYHDDTGIYISSDKGITWKTTSASGTILSFVVMDSLVFASGWPGVYFSSDWGENWTLKNEGFIYDEFTYPSITSLIILEDYLYAGSPTGIWKRPLSEFISGVTEADKISKMPLEYGLSQNFPNPFNPSTRIKFSVTEQVNVILKIYDALGREVETLLNEVKPAGIYEINWNAGKLPTGVYFYQLKAGDFIQSRKMILLK